MFIGHLVNVSPYQKVNKWQLLGWTLDNDTIFDEQLMHALCTLQNNEAIFTFTQNSAKGIRVLLSL